MKPFNYDTTQAEKRLARNLKNLPNYCRPEYLEMYDNEREFFAGLLQVVYDSSKFGCWPSHQFLRQIQEDVLEIAQCGRVRKIFPVWKAFEQVNERKKKLKLTSCVTDLIIRARGLLPRESEFERVLRLLKPGDGQARRDYHDMLEDSLRDPRKFAELLQAHEKMMKHRFMVEPLVHWIVLIRHPMAKDFHSIADCCSTLEESKARREAYDRRERVQRHRSRKKILSKSVSPI